MTNRSTRPLRARRLTARICSAATWPVCGLLILLHVRYGVLPSARVFAVVWTWLVALGCVGCPVYGLRLLGDRLTTACARHVGLVFTGVSLLVTALLATGQLHPRTPIVYAALILPMAIAIQGLNGAETLDRAESAYQRGRRDALRDTLQDRRALAAALTELGDTELDQLVREHEVLGRIIDARAGDERTRRTARGSADRPGLRAL